MLYEHLIRPVLFKASSDPEIVHEKVMSIFRLMSTFDAFCRGVERFTTVESDCLKQKVFGLDFRNPVGLAAGFDKYAQALPFLQALGFGFLEAGTFTRYAQEGNPRPRVFRFPKDYALINQMGFNNPGIYDATKTLSMMKKLDIPLGISLGKSKVTPLKDAVSDYLYSFEKSHPYVDYFVINVSSPNTPGLRKLQDKNLLDELLGAIQEKNTTMFPKKPILLKISPDLSFNALDELLSVCSAKKVDGLIATNTTLAREGLQTSTEKAGGMSGRPLFQKSLAIVRYIYRELKGNIPVIGVGGIFSAQDAYKMIQAGAFLVQIYTGLIYKGPFFVREINQGLVELMRRDGVCSLSEVLGTEIKN